MCNSASIDGIQKTAAKDGFVNEAMTYQNSRSRRHLTPKQSYRNNLNGEAKIVDSKRLDTSDAEG